MGKKEIKVTLALIFLIVALIVIAVLGINLIKINNEKVIAHNEIETLKLQVNELNEEITNMKNIEKENKLSEEDAKNIVEEKFDEVSKIMIDKENFFEITSDNEIVGFEETVLKYGTEDFLKEVKNIYSNITEEKNGKLYLLGHGGFVSYDGIDSINDVHITETEIEATVVIKTLALTSDSQTVPSDNKEVEIKLVKVENEWLVDEIDLTIFE